MLTPVHAVASAFDRPVASKAVNAKASVTNALLASLGAVIEFVSICCLQRRVCACERAVHSIEGAAAVL